MSYIFLDKEITKKTVSTHRQLVTPFFSPDWWIGNEQLFKAGLDSFVLVAYASSGACLSELYFRFRRFTLLVQIEKVISMKLLQQHKHLRSMEIKEA